MTGNGTLFDIVESITRSRTQVDRILINLFLCMSLRLMPVDSFGWLSLQCSQFQLNLTQMGAGSEGRVETEGRIGNKVRNNIREWKGGGAWWSSLCTRRLWGQLEAARHPLHRPLLPASHWHSRPHRNHGLHSDPHFAFLFFPDNNLGSVHYRSIFPDNKGRAPGLFEVHAWSFLWHDFARWESWRN